MSWEAVSWAWSLKLRSNEKFVLMGLANYVNQEASFCYPSLDELIFRLGMSRPTVIKLIDGLVAKNLIVKSRSKNHYGGNFYHLNMENTPAALVLPKKTSKKSLPETSKETLPDQVKKLNLKQVKKLNPNLIILESVDESGTRSSLAKEEAKDDSTEAIAKSRKCLNLPQWLDVSVWQEFKRTRQRMRKPMTPRAEELMLKDLAKLKDQGHDPTEVLEQSIKKSWLGVWPTIKDKQGRFSERTERLLKRGLDADEQEVF